MADIVYEAVAICGKRKDDKPNYVKIGTVFRTAKGLSLKLDSIPAGNEWNGWVSLFEPKPREGNGARTGTVAPAARSSPTQLDPDDDIPFAPRHWKEGL